MMESSSVEENTLAAKNELDTGLVPCETLAAKIITSDAGENNPQIRSSMGEEGTLGSNVQENHQAMKNSSPRQEPFVEENGMAYKYVPIEPMEVAIGSDAREKHKTSQSFIAEDTTLGSDEQNNNQIMKSSSPRVKPFVEDNEMVTKDAPTMETGVIGSDAGQNDQTLQSVIPEGSTLGSDEEGNYKILNCSSPREKSVVETNEVGSKSIPMEPMDSVTVKSDAEESSQMLQSSVMKESTSGEKHELGSELVQGGTENHQAVGIASPNKVGNEQLEVEAMGPSIPGSNSVALELLETPSVDKKLNFDGPAENVNRESSRSLKRKHDLSSSDRVLRSKLHDASKPPDPSPSSVNVTNEIKKRKRRKMINTKLKDEFSKTRQRLRYMLNRMGFEHNLIEAYSGEGWKGQSSEKIKLEKELQRASSEILRCKRKIRDLFQHLDSLCMEGKLQDSLFDSEGQISSEDIFCAKCGAKDLSTDNDIILCDGICDRGFHQMCLEPPLLKEEIPPGDEGWLCPGCDCKVDCMDLLNDIQGTHLSINDSWKKVFPEAAITAGDMLDNNFGLPSDDSEDDDYDPDGLELDEEVQTDGSSSDESDFSSDSDDSGTVPNDDQYAGLPSDDSEDDDYDPTAPDVEQKKTDSSSSDFTSDSEYFSASSDANGPSVIGEVLVSSADGVKFISGSSNRSSKLDVNKKQSVSAELLALQEPDLSQGNSSPVSGKRKRERLDYKKLHDEEYGNGPDDSSDDEDWYEADAPNDSKGAGVGKQLSLSPKADSRTFKGRKNTWASRQNSKGTANRRIRQKVESKCEDTLSAETKKDSLDCGHIRKRGTPSASKTLGEAVTQRFFAVFKENEYPNREMKDNLAKEFGLTTRQVGKWFDNARWSAHHSSGDTARKGKKVSPSVVATTVQTNGKLTEREANTTAKDVTGNDVEDLMSKEDAAGVIAKEFSSKDVDKSKCVTKESSPTKFSTPKSMNRRKGKMVSPSMEATVAQTNGKRSEPESNTTAKDAAGNDVEDRELHKEGTAKVVPTESSSKDTKEIKSAMKESSSKPNSRNRRNVKVDTGTAKEDSTSKKKSKDTPTTPLRRSGRKKNPEVTPQIQTRSRRSGV